LFLRRGLLLAADYFSAPTTRRASSRSPV